MDRHGANALASLWPFRIGAGLRLSDESHYVPDGFRLSRHESVLHDGYGQGFDERNAYMMGIRLRDSHSSRNLLGGVIGGVAAVVLFSTVIPKTLSDVRAITVGRSEENDEYVRVAKGSRNWAYNRGHRSHTSATLLKALCGQGWPGSASLRRSHQKMRRIIGKLIAQQNTTFEKS